MNVRGWAVWFVCLAGCSVFAPPAWGRAPLQGVACDTLEVHRTDEAHVLASRAAASISTPQPLQQMDRKELEALGLTGLSDAVKRFAGTNVKDYGGLGGMKTVSVRNLGAQHTAVSYDGVVQSNTQAGQIDLGRFAMENVERLTLAVGSTPDIMQSARHYAAASVLDIKSDVTPRLFRKNDEESSMPRLGYFTIKGGSFGFVSPSLRYIGRLGETTAVTVDAKYLRSDGAYPFKVDNAGKLIKLKRYNSDISSSQGEVNLIHAFQDSSLLRAKASYYRSKRALPGSVIFYANPSEERMWDEDVFAQVGYERSLARHWQIETRGRFAHSYSKYIDPKLTQRDVDRQNEYYGSATVGWHPLPTLHIALAEDLSFNTLRNNIRRNIETGPAQPRRFTTLTALSAQWNLERLKVMANLVTTYATEHVAAGKSQPDRFRMSPTLSASYRLLPGEAFYVRMLFKNTFRMPTFNDLYYLRMGNAGLRPEKAREWNAGITWSTTRIGWLKYFSMAIDAYYNTVDDKIVAFPSTYVWRMANFGRVHIYGADITLTAEVPIADDVSATFIGALTQQKAENLTDKKSQTYKNDLPYTPRTTGSATVILNNPWVTASWTTIFCGSRYSMGQNKPEYRMRPYAESTLTLSREIKWGATRIKLQGSMVNVENKQYEIIQYYPMPRRSWNVAATVYL